MHPSMAAFAATVAASLPMLLVAHPGLMAVFPEELLPAACFQVWQRDPQRLAWPPEAANGKQQYCQQLMAPTHEHAYPRLYDGEKPPTQQSESHGLQEAVLAIFR
jgi:hypothetical protein